MKNDDFTGMISTLRDAADAPHENAAMLRIFVGEHDRHHGRNLFEVLVEEARTAGLAGATVFGGFMGFGANSRVHTVSVFRLSQDLPVVVEIIDDETKIRAFLPRVESLLCGGGMITLERVTIVRYQPEKDAS